MQTIITIFQLILIPDTYEQNVIKSNILKNYELSITDEELTATVEAAFFYAKTTKVDPVKILSLMLKESRLNPNAVSKTGVRGACQMSGSACDYHKLDRDSLSNIIYGVFACAVRLRDIRSKFISIPEQIVAYNAYKLAMRHKANCINRHEYVEYKQIYDKIKF